MPKDKPMTPELFNAIAQRFRILSDPMRLQIMYRIGEGERTVSELVEATGGSQSNISKHLSTLLAHGLVRRRREGTSAFYSITELSVFELCDQVCGGIERTLEERRQELR
jgi:DNA-binding transcriptional ArsR family regulator